MPFMPDEALQSFNLAQSFKTAGDYKAACDSLKTAVKCNPDFFEARVNLSETCRYLGDYADAIHHLVYALKLKPDFHQGLNALGVLYQKTGDAKAAISSFKKAVDCKPDFPDAYYNLGNSLRDIEQFDEAIVCFRMALSLKPSSIEALSNLGEALQITGSIKEAEACFKSAIDIDPSCSIAFSNYLLTLNYDPEFGPRELYDRHRKYGATFTPSQLPFSFANDRSPIRRLRIGYVSGDFRNHPVAHFFKPVFFHHYATDFDVFCYSNARNPDETTELLRKHAGHWLNVFGMPDSELVDAIRAEAIDILVDLSGHSADNRLPVFAQKAAPVQVTYLGYPNTTGLAAMDYRITDRVADPLCEAPVHTEKLVRLSPCFCCYSPPSAAPAPGPVPFRQNGFVTFGSTHMLGRINDDVLDLWASLLQSVPLSRLFIMRTTLTGGSLDRVNKRFESHGIEKSRIIVKNTVPAAEGHLAVYREMDIFLDSFPWSGHASACEALWMGVPVVTLLGDRHAGRMVSSVLSCLDMKDCIAGTKDDYLAVARGLAKDIDRLENLRLTLRDRMKNSPLCDGKTFAANLEEAYRTMWLEWCGKQQATTTG
jgi:predicted O-linked N-acetylglucosamine transferase (SPINDLY family)